MEPKPFHLLSCIFLLFLIYPFLFSCTHAHNSSHQQPPAMNFLKTLIGTRKGHSAKGLSQFKKYLSNLGYIHNNDDYRRPVQENSDQFDHTLEQAIKKYQAFFKLPITGVLDSDTIAKMRQPRCGMPDFVINTNRSSGGDRMIAASHYTFFPGSPKWPKRLLTYSFPPHTRNDALRAIHDAMNIWCSVSPLRFKHILNFDQADIKISFQRRDHGDGSPFDGTGGVLAHAAGPTNGNLHFDADENWVDGVKPGAFDLQTIGLHELGHILGLGHSNDGGAIMYPYIGNGFRKGLGQDDINGIRALYRRPS